MKGTRIAINAAMFAPAVRVNAVCEADVRAVICSDDGTRAIFEELRGRRRSVRVIRRRFVVEWNKAIGRIRARAPASDWLDHGPPPVISEQFFMTLFGVGNFSDRPYI